jgi:hypothetical protein
VLALACLLELALPRPAVSQSDAAEIEALIRQGVELRKQGKDERALPLFQKAYDRSRTPRTEGQLGLAEMAVGYWLEAEQHLSSSLDAPDHPWVAKNRASLERALGEVRTHLAELTVDGSPAGASVTIDGRRVGVLPLLQPALVRSGKVVVEVAAAGHQSATETVVVAGRERRRVTVRLEKLASDVAPVAAPQPAPPPSPVLASPPQPVQPNDSARGTYRPLGLALGIAAAAALGFGAVETIIWQKKRIEFNNHKAAPPDNPDVRDMTMWVNDCDTDLRDQGSPACHALYDGAKRATRLSLIGYGSGLALGVGSLIAFLMKPDVSSAQTRLSCSTSPGPVVSCGFLF